MRLPLPIACSALALTSGANEGRAEAGRLAVAARGVARGTAQRPVDSDLATMLGYDPFGAANDDAARRHALAVMEMAELQMDHPQFRTGLARACTPRRQPPRGRRLRQPVLASRVQDAELRAEAEAYLARLPR